MPDNGRFFGDQSEVLDFLSQPTTYGIVEKPIRIETHVAVVFLAGQFAYKMNRAVRYPFLDFSTLDKRRAACEAEIAVNQRNAPEIYIDTVPVVRRDGALNLGGDGDVVEWLARMHRFDPADTLDHVAERGQLNDAIIAALVAAISKSHAIAEVGDGDAATRRLEGWMRGNADELSAWPELVQFDDVEDLRRTSQAEFDRVTDLLLSRGRAGFVRRCHGDLHLRNVVLIDGRPVLFDALEFDDAFATHDIFYDLAFLLMDLWQRDMRFEANRVLNRYLWLNNATTDIDGCRLMPLFMSIRAAIRAKVGFSTAQIDESQRVSDEVRAAQGYFSHARRFLLPAEPRLVAIGGRSGSGKTTISAALAPYLGRAPGAIHLRSDIERKRLAGLADTEHLPSSAYTREASETIYARLREKAARALRAGQSVIVDAVHGRAEERTAIEKVAQENGVTFVGLWLDAPQETLLARVSARQNDASDADANVVKDQFARPVGSILWPRVDTAAPDHLARCRQLAGTAGNET